MKIDGHFSDIWPSRSAARAVNTVYRVTIQKLGVDTTSFAAVIAAAGLAIGLALQGSLSNFASGVMLIALRPFKVGDYIEAGGTSGTVSAIAVFATELLTPDNRMVIVPNSAVASSTITNYSAKT
ncbi:MAG TPA: mechanosensitive ion channel domain-containing protein [Vicinamibacteria bacterium]|nr:mechanosensitive ion channel domain-containing protein [Vicinamibacteria bacterium]